MKLFNQARETELIIAGLLDKPNIVGDLLINQGDPEAQRLLGELAKFLTYGPEPILAMTDPIQYRFFRNIQTELTLRGVHRLLSRPNKEKAPPDHTPRRRTYNGKTTKSMSSQNPSIPARGLDRKQWMEKIRALDKELAKQAASGKIKSDTRLEIIGAWPIISNGLAGRTSIDLDVWKSGSKYNEADLRDACEAIGLDYNPMGDEDTLTKPYLQIVEAGIVQVPSHKPVESVVFKHLKITAPPGEVLIASKLLRSSPKDIEDCVFLMQKFDIPVERIEKAIKRFDRPQDRELAQENMVYLTYNIGQKEEKKIEQRTPQHGMEM